MIPQQKDRKSKFIFIYIILFIFINSINNKNFHNKELFSNNLIFEVNGLPYVDNQKLKRDLIIKKTNCEIFALEHDDPNDFQDYVSRSLNFLNNLEI